MCSYKVIYLRKCTCRFVLDLVDRWRSVFRLLKYLYNLEQASHKWNLKLTKALISNGYAQTKHNYSMFTKARGPRNGYYARIRRWRATTFNWFRNRNLFSNTASKLKILEILGIYIGLNWLNWRMTSFSANVHMHVISFFR